MQVLGKNWNGRQSSVGKISKLVSLLLLLLLLLYCSPQLFQTLFIFCHLQLSSLIGLDWRVLACIGGWEWGATDVLRFSTFWWIVTTTNAQIRNAKCRSSCGKNWYWTLFVWYIDSAASPLCDGLAQLPKQGYHGGMKSCLSKWLKTISLETSNSTKYQIHANCPCTLLISFWLQTTWGGRKGGSQLGKLRKAIKCANRNGNGNGIWNREFGLRYTLKLKYGERCGTCQITVIYLPFGKITNRFSLIVADTYLRQM